jgi:hypothetical protein
MDQPMKFKVCALLAVIAALVSPGSARAQITTVILADEDQVKFTVSAANAPTQTAELKFTIGPVPFAGAQVKEWQLRVVPTKSGDKRRRANQDVTVISENQHAGQWSAYGSMPKPYAPDLDPKAFKPGPDRVVKLTLKTQSRLTEWDYHGGKATNAADRPRLILTFHSVSPAQLTPTRSGQSTDWKYPDPEHFFSSVFWSAGTLVANPVSYSGGVYVIASSGGGRSLSRVTGTRQAASWPCPPSFRMTDKSFVFVTAWGRLQIITEDAIARCDVTKLGRPGTMAAFDVTESKIKVNESETPAMGPDGSLYFKNVKAEGALIGYNPAGKEIWRTELKFTRVSPISLNADGRFAYVLADFPVESGIKSKTIALVRVDTATGETMATEVKYKDTNGNDVFPDLAELLRPAVASKRYADGSKDKDKVDYVFVAGNTSDSGILQLIAFEPTREQPIVLWSRPGKLQSSPVLSVVDGNSVFAVRDGSIERYIWYQDKGSAGAFQGSAPKPQVIQRSKGAVKSSLFIDGADSLYLLASEAAQGGAQEFFVCSYNNARKWKESSSERFKSPSSNLLFTSDGALMGYDSGKMYDLSPKVVNLAETVKTLAAQTIFSAGQVTLAPDAAKQLKDGDQVILKGNEIKLPKRFTWPRHKTLKLQTVRKAS